MRRVDRHRRLPRPARAAAGCQDERQERDSVERVKVLACCALAGLVPTPIGVGPRFHPRANRPAECRPAALRAGDRVHVELFARRRVVVVPTMIGLRHARLRLGRVVAASCRARAWTLDPSGVVHFEPGTTLGGVFRVWREPLGPGRLLSFRGAVALYVNGERRRVDPRVLRLRNGDEVALEVGGYVPPHRSFRFPP
jgi:hypothetical protein